MNLSEDIEQQIKSLKELKPNQRSEALKVISSTLNQYFRRINFKSFDRSFLASFFEENFYPKETQRRYTKQILFNLLQDGLIIEDKTEKVYKRKRINQLFSNDFEDYNILMTKNGYSKIDFFVFKTDKWGVSRRHKTESTDLNGEPLNDFDISQLRQTRSRDNQGVYTFGNKSISIDKTTKKVKCFKIVY